MSDNGKMCRHCDAIKPLSEFPSKGAKCKQCVSRYNRARYQADRDAIRAKQNAYHKQYYADNRDRLREWHRQYREANRDVVLARKRAYYAVNRVRLLAEMKAYQAANAERYRINGREWRAANPARHSSNSKAYRARKMGALGSHTEEDWNRMLRIWDWSCAYCGERGALTRDHVIPLSRGGSDFIGNIVPACKSCNCSKHARLIVEWVAS